MTSEWPASRPLNRLTPSLLDALVSCRLRVSFMQAGAGGVDGRAPAARLGDTCHHVLDHLVRTRDILQPGWESALEEYWAGDIAHQGSLQGEDDLRRWGPPEAWPNYQLNRARLRNVAKRLRELLLPLPPEAVVLTECELSARQGLLRGRADLIVRSATCHIIIDYKSGAVVDSETKKMVPAYERQLKLYAALEREDSGEWPQRAILMPLNGPAIEITIDPTDCDAIADNAVALLMAYNHAAPGPQPANPSPMTCRSCVASCQCPAFWANYQLDWAPELLALKGHIHSLSLTPLGGLAMTVGVEAGVGQPRAHVRGLQEAQYGSVGGLQVGDTIAIVGLREDPERAAFYLPLGGRLAKVV